MCDCGACTGPESAENGSTLAAPRLTRRVLLGGALAAGAMALATPAAAQRAPSLIQGADLQSDRLFSERIGPGRVRRGRRAHPGQPIARQGPSTLQWPSGLSEHRLALHNVATGEHFDGVIWADGRFDDDAMARLNMLMRDTHSSTVIPCDARLFDLLACVQVRIARRFHVVSGFRTSATNAALARRDPHVARNSFHIRGMAVDFFVEGVPPRQIAQKAREVGAGGVGIYAGASFVHLDTGPMRSWAY